MYRSITLWAYLDLTENGVELARHGRVYGRHVVLVLFDLVLAPAQAAKQKDQAQQDQNQQGQIDVLHDFWRWKDKRSTDDQGKISLISSSSGCNPTPNLPTILSDSSEELLPAPEASAKLAWAAADVSTEV